VDEAVSHGSSEEEEATEEDEKEEELMQLLHGGTLCEIPYSPVRSFRTQHPSATFVHPTQRNPRPMTVIHPYSRIRTNLADTVGSNSSTGQETDSGENVPQARDSEVKKTITDSDDEGEKEWANYWPPSSPSSDTKNEEEEVMTPETEIVPEDFGETKGNEQTILNLNQALTDLAICAIDSLEEVGGPHETKGQTPEMTPGCGTGRASRCNHYDARTDSPVKEEATRIMFEDHVVQLTETRGTGTIGEGNENS
jgi:hypothetical protein